MTKDQAEIIRWAQSVGGYFTKQEACRQAWLGGKYYMHPEKYVGDRLSRMVDAGLLERTAPGKYKIGKGKKNKPATVDANQPELFK